MRKWYLILTSGLVSLGLPSYVLSSPHAHHQRCRCLSSDPCWPSQSVWTAFNSSISGALLSINPTAQACHAPHYDAHVCQAIRDDWMNPFWRVAQPGTLQDPADESLGNSTCSPWTPKSTPCGHGNLPTYAVNVTSAAQVSKTMKFAKKHNLRVVIRSTGHDFHGRSTAAGSLSLWMHNLKKMEFHDAFVPTKCSKSKGTAVTVGSGVVLHELYETADKRGLALVAGEALTVGVVGGYLQGGGHSALGPYKGMAADNALEFLVVLANGHMVTANECQEKDLFWALRGGGGGTYGVVIQATLHTFPTPSMHLTSINATMNNVADTTFFLNNFFTLLRDLNRHAWGGYFYMLDTRFLGILFAPNKTDAEATQELASLSDFQSKHPDLLQPISPAYPISTFFKLYNGTTTNLGQSNSSDADPPSVSFSRLIPRSIPIENITQAYIQSRGPSTLFITHLVAGGAVSRVSKDFNAVHPAWRTAFVHTSVLNAANPDAFKDLVKPKSKDELGFYLNEGDPLEQHAQMLAFGSHLQRLQQIKEKVDPGGLLTCLSCVGSEKWTPDGNCRV
ncbi:uncharacterized protein EV422DRAFT_613365 [Fimicolochytrium jonesii]|uniref:uncharacterized protein n=1 Tax=Fimicolochytrium jonesii TaxID=1396493 RepID=UPI0022FF2F91|nr:uncharacterized protein EV422DRAFT_613365 [Fimicolochytrium jonesii]KAI8823193.1 hypothetical protein EV422DRAFT_613365 [Fimicolochytrium jonesii]